MTRVTQLIHDAGKYQLISVYPLPTHPTHNFTHKNGGNLETLNAGTTDYDAHCSFRDLIQFTCYVNTYWHVIGLESLGWTKKSLINQNVSGLANR